MIKIQAFVVAAALYGICYSQTDSPEGGYKLIKDLGGDGPQEGRVIFGYRAPEGLVPYIASQSLNPPNSFCGCTILNENFLLTAAHCAQDDPTQVTIRYGITRLNDPQALEVQVEQFVPHPNYTNKGTESTITEIRNDIALLKVATPLDLSGKAQAIELTDAKPEEGTEALLAGWGIVFIFSPNNLQAANLTIVPCEGRIPNTFTEFICTQQLQSATPGDSGGPLAVDEKLVGVVSFGNMISGLNGYTDVNFYRDWIEETMASLS